MRHRGSEPVSGGEEQRLCGTVKYTSRDTSQAPVFLRCTTAPLSQAHPLPSLRPTHFHTMVFHCSPASHENESAIKGPEPASLGLDAFLDTSVAALSPPLSTRAIRSTERRQAIRESNASSNQPLTETKNTLKEPLPPQLTATGLGKKRGLQHFNTIRRYHNRPWTGEPTNTFVTTKAERAWAERHFGAK